MPLTSEVLTVLEQANSQNSNPKNYFFIIVYPTIAHISSGDTPIAPLACA